MSGFETRGREGREGKQLTLPLRSRMAINEQPGMVERGIEREEGRDAGLMRWREERGRERVLIDWRGACTR